MDGGVTGHLLMKQRAHLLAKSQYEYDLVGEQVMMMDPSWCIDQRLKITKHK